jgi:transcriptional regulator with XRE-family HTH domain
MSSPVIHGKALVFSETNARQVVAESLQNIKDAKGYTDVDLGRILGKSEDTAALYRKGHSGMDAFSLLAAWREWNGEFIGTIRRFVEASRPKSVDDRIASHSVLTAAVALSEAMTLSGDLDAAELLRNRPKLEQARDALDAVLGNMKPEAVA